MERYWSTGQSPQRAVAPTEEEKEVEVEEEEEEEATDSCIVIIRCTENF
jgi:hypothetical protein